MKCGPLMVRQDKSESCITAACAAFHAALSAHSSAKRLHPTHLPMLSPFLKKLTKRDRSHPLSLREGGETGFLRMSGGHSCRRTDAEVVSAPRRATTVRGWCRHRTISLTPTLSRRERELTCQRSFWLAF